jgi:RHS repeat-associated protein
VLNNGIYVPETGDYSSLVLTVDNIFTLTYQNGTKEKFNSSGQIITSTDGNGNSLTFYYDTYGNLASVTDAAARTTTFAYNANKLLTTIIDPAGNNYSFTYSGNYLTAVTWPDGGSWLYTYDTNGLMQSKTDPMGKVTTYTYDGNHRVTTATDSAGTNSFAYPNVTNTVNSVPFTNDDGGVWTYTYDYHNSYMTQKTDPLGKSTIYTYDANRNLINETAPDGSFTSYTYDAAGNMLTKTDAMGNTTTYAYNSLGQVTSVTDPLGQTTTSNYDVKGNLTQTADAVGAITTYSYDARGNLTAVSNSLNQSISFTYDAANNQITSTDQAGATTTFTYDAMGNMLTRTDPLGKVTTFGYDGRYRLAKSTDPLGNVTNFTYDFKGNRTSQTDANGNVTGFGYDDQGHLATAIDALNNATTYTYAATGCPSCGGGSGKLKSLTDANGHATSYQYDLLSHLTQETDPLGKNTTYAYNVVGNLTSRTDANGAVVNYTYDLLKRLTNKSYPDSTSVSYTYDALGRILTSGNANTIYTYAYDAAGRVTSVTDSRGYIISYFYDSLGNRTRMNLQPGTPDARITTYTYDVDSRLTGISGNAGTFTYGYDVLGRRTSLAYPNQITANYTYDDAGRLTALTQATSGSTLASFTYTLDKVGNRLSKSGTANETYGYDFIYRLLQDVKVKGTEKYTYDAVGNRLTGPGPKDISYLYNADNQMTTGRQFSYVYDNNGNQVTRTTPNAADRTWTQTWDYENQLTKLQKVKGAENRTIAFAYDPQGRRIGKQLTTIINGVTSTDTWSYIYDNDNIVLEVYTDGTGSVTKTWYTQGPGTDEHLALERSGSFYYYHADGLGSIVDITDANRNVVQSYGYDSFGMAKPSTSFINNYTYTGREFDKETGLYYYRARYYDPMEGRFISKDPIGFKGGDVNIYAYVGNNVINKTDPMGLQASSSQSCNYGRYVNCEGLDFISKYICKKAADSACKRGGLIVCCEAEKTGCLGCKTKDCGNDDAKWKAAEKNCESEYAKCMSGATPTQ